MFQMIFYNGRCKYYHFFRILKQDWNIVLLQTRRRPTADECRGGCVPGQEVWQSAMSGSECQGAWHIQWKSTRATLHSIQN